MKGISSTLAIFAILVPFSLAFSFGPKSYIYSDAEISNMTRTTQTQSQRYSRDSISFPTVSSHLILRPTFPPPSLRNTTTTSTTLLASTVKPSLSATVLANNKTETQNNSKVLQNSTLPSTSTDNNGTIHNHTTTYQNQTVPICKPGPESESTSSRSYLTDAFIRTKLCSNISAANLSRGGFRFDLDAKVCSPVGKQSHCGKNMIFYSFAGNSVYGHCDCDYSSKIPLLYHEETNRCYFMYQQGFCKQEDWIEMRKESGKAICSRNKCYNSGRGKFGAPPLASRDMAPEYVPLRGDGPCVRLNQPNQQYCKRRGDVVAFRWPLEFYPNCGEARSLPSTPPPGTTMSPSNATVAGPILITPRFLGEVASLECNPGSYLNAVGSCQPDWDFD